MFRLDLRSLNAQVAPLVDAGRINDLGPGERDQSAYAGLKDLTPAALAAPRSLHDREMAQACLAGLWLFWDFLDESHQISQSLDTPEGSYWHAIMHRREPDYGNAKYWFRRLGQHPIFPQLATEARGLAGVDASPEVAHLRVQDRWDPYRFVDLCQSAHDGQSAATTLCRQVQRTEWQLLFTHCLRAAVGD
jgi:hypothetical protein